MVLYTVLPGLEIPVGQMVAFQGPELARSPGVLPLL